MYAFGYTYICGVSPDLLSDTSLKKCNGAFLRKIAPKKSWEIKNNNSVRHRYRAFVDTHVDLCGRHLDTWFFVMLVLGLVQFRLMSRFRFEY